MSETSVINTNGWKELAEILGVMRVGGNESIPSVELKNAAKGNIQATVKVYHPDINQASTDAQFIFDALRAKYNIE